MQKKRILLIENEPDLRRMIQEILEGAGYELLIEVNGVDGCRAVELKKPDLVIVDLMLPGENGLDICKKIKNTPVIILSAGGKEADLATWRGAGVDDYIYKPFATSEFIHKIEAVLRRS